MVRLVLRRGLIVLLPIVMALSLLALGRALPVRRASAQGIVFPIVATVLQAANVRSGPGTQFPIISGAHAGAHLNVIGCNGDCSWYQLAADCWIAAFLVQPEQPIAPPILTPLTTPAAVVILLPGSVPLPTVVLSLPVTTTPGASIQTTHCPQTSSPTTTYAGPGESYGVVDMRPAGECVSVIGRNATGDSFQLAHGPWIHASAVLYADPLETIPVTDQPYTPTPVLPPTPLPPASMAFPPTPLPPGVVATPVPTETVDLSEIMTVGEWREASEARKAATALIWTQRLVSAGTVTTDPVLFAGNLMDCVDTALEGTEEIVDAEEPVTDMASACAILLNQ